MNKLSYKILTILCCLAIFSSCIDENYQEEPTGLTEKPLLSTVLEAQPDLSTFNQMVDLARLRGRLVGNKTQDQRAVFAPTNAAVANYLAANRFTALGQIPNIQNLVGFHITNANVQQATLAQTNFTSIQTIATRNISVTRTGGQIRLNNQVVNILRSITDGNGTIHVIDQVLVP
jgi:uncharacterized surface protein with fasciclin (FAS1) repeats